MKKGSKVTDTKGKAKKDFAQTAPYDYDTLFQQGLAALDKRIAQIGQAAFEAETGAQLRELQDKGYRL